MQKAFNISAVLVFAFLLLMHSNDIYAFLTQP